MRNHEIMLQIHNEGKGYCGAFSLEIAETKSQQINQFSKENEHPLKTDIEELQKIRYIKYMLSKNLENSLNVLFKECSENLDEFVTIEHLLLVLTQEDSARKVFEHLSIDIDSLQKEIKDYIGKSMPKSKEKKEIQPTLAFQRVLQRAIFHVQSSGKNEVLGENLLAALFSEKESYAVYMLNRRNISRLDVVDYISHGKNTAVQTEEVTEEAPKEKISPTF